MSLVRDIAIILIAVETLVVGAFLIVLIWEIRSLTKMLREEILPIINSADQTVRTVRTTTSFVSENLVQPVARLNGFFAGIAEALRIITRRK
ncbi:MAG TPA: hypothetical protein VIX58_01065 [Anaerolineae bacterium]